MGIPSDPDAGSPVGEFSTKTCPKCGRVERISVCQEEGCGQAFVPQPGCSTNLCPLHDPKLDPAPDSYRPYKTKKAMECARCRERILGTVAPE